MLVKYCLVSVPCVSKCSFLPIIVALLYTCPPAYGVLSSERCPAVIHEYFIASWCYCLPAASSNMFFLKFIWNLAAEGFDRIKPLRFAPVRSFVVAKLFDCNGLRRCL